MYYGDLAFQLIVIIIHKHFVMQRAIFEAYFKTKRLSKISVELSTENSLK